MEDKAGATSKIERGVLLMSDFSKSRKLPHPLQAKFDSGELKSVNRWDIPDDEWNVKMVLLDEDERETANWYRQEKMREKYGLSLTVVDRVVVTASMGLITLRYEGMLGEVEQRKLLQVAGGQRFAVVNNHIFGMPELPRLLFTHVNANEPEINAVNIGSEAMLV